MELEVLNTRGIPKSGLLSISAGGMRKQVQLSAIDKPLRFPADEISQIKVDVLDVLGRARLPYHPEEQKYTLPLDLSESGQFTATVGENMEVDLIVRPCRPDTPSSPVKDELSRVRRELDANGYLEEHDLVNFITFVLQSLMQDKPADPYPFLQKQVAMRMSRQAGSTPAYPATPSGGAGVPEALPKIELVREATNSLKVPSIQDSETAITSILKKLTPRATAAGSAEEIAELERQAIEASKRLREDNAKLRETAEQMKAEYEKLMQESQNLHVKIDAKKARKAAASEALKKPAVLPFVQYYERHVGRQCGQVYWNTIHSKFWSRPETPAALAPVVATKESRTAAAYREIEKLQDEVAQLARENAKLVSDLARGREMIDLVRQDMIEIRRSVGED
jgi:hypothetical protein